MFAKFLIIFMFINNSDTTNYVYKPVGWGFLKGEGVAGLPGLLGLRGLIGMGKQFGIGGALELYSLPFKIYEYDENGNLIDSWIDTENCWFIPLYLYYVPKIEFKEIYPDGPAKGWVWYNFAGIYVYGSGIGMKRNEEDVESWFPGYVIGTSIEYFTSYLTFGIEAGFRKFKFKYHESKYIDTLDDYIHYTHEILPISSFYVSLKIGLGPWGPYEIKKVYPPVVRIYPKFSDLDKNNILSENDTGTLKIKIENKGKGKMFKTTLELSILENHFKNKIKISQPAIFLGDIKPMDKREINVELKPLEKLPKGEFTVSIKCKYQTELNEKDIKTKIETIKIRTASAGGMIRVAFTGISPEGMPEWIIPTPLEYADYEVSYKNNKVQILNLNTGERFLKRVSSKSSAKEIVKKYFLNWDKQKPKIILSTRGGKIRARKVKLFARFSDDRKLDKVEIYLNDKLYKTEAFAERTETEREYEFPLKMGDNTIKFVLTDWVGKKAEKEISFTRIRGGTGTWIAGKLPRKAPPPKLVVKAYTLDGNNTIVGGKEEGLVVSITNKGKGIAKWVRVILEGDKQLVNLWGKERNLEDIKPGQTKSATFSILMPTELKRRKAKIKIIVKEGRGYSPRKKPVFKFTLIPGKTVEEKVELVEDVDYDIPKGRIRRKKGYALIIGISKYLNVKGPEYARNDAETFKKYVNKVFGIPIRNIKLLVDEKATGNLIKAELKEWLKRKRGFKIIFFAGHGAPDPQNPRKGDVYILPYDGDPELKSTLISIKELSRLPYNKGDTVLIFLDACYSGGEGRSAPLSSRPLAVVKLPQTKSIIFAAAEGTQPSKEFKEAKHGYFTYYVLLGLKGKADINRDGWITTIELYEFVRDKVMDATNAVQIPVLKPLKKIKLTKIK